MRDLIVEDILKATNGELITGNKKGICPRFSNDTRTLEYGDVYIGIKGEKFDGNELWEKALEKGAGTVIVENINFDKGMINKHKGVSIIKVDNTIKALGDLAKYRREMFDIPVIAITGSVGKTSTKDIVASVVSKKYKTLKTEGNNNNDIGLPLTLLRLKDEEAAVIEMGMNHLEEIDYLTNIAQPTLSVITNVGTSHIGNLGSRENILKAKLEILHGMKEKKLIVNNDNDLLHVYYEQNKGDFEIKTFGLKNKSDINGKDVVLKENSGEFTFGIDNINYNVIVPVGGEHFIYNALCAITVGKVLGIDNDDIIAGIEGFELTKKRMDIDLLSNGTKIINDTYNASYESMSAALKYLSQFKENRTIAVLGDMFELGEFSKELHEKVGIEVVKNKINILMCYGNAARDIVEQAKKNGMKKTAYYYETAEELIDAVVKTMTYKDIVLFKASNGMKFFDILSEIKKRI